MSRKLYTEEEMRLRRNEQHARRRAIRKADPVLRAEDSAYWAAHYEHNRTAILERMKSRPSRAVDPSSLTDEQRLYRERVRGEAQLRRRARTYGLTWQQALVFEDIKACQICGSDDPGTRGHVRFPIDHDHQTGRVRGVLCSGCNNGLGRFKDDPARMRAAADYIERHLAITHTEVSEA